MTSAPAVSITAAETVCALGNSTAECLETWRLGRTGLTNQEGVLAGRIRDRGLLAGRRYGAASNVAVVVARRAVERAGWDRRASDDVWLFAASSRGNVGEILGAHGWRRGSRRFSASNSMHSEIAAAVSIELGLRGPWQMIANGCSAGVDALGLAWLALRAGLTKRALVVAVDLPLAPRLLADFADSRLLSKSHFYDPLAPDTDGFMPGEGAAAVTLEVLDTERDGFWQIDGYGANSEAYDSMMSEPDGAALARLVQGLTGGAPPDIVCPHATGTANHCRSEVAALRAVFREAIPPLLLMKPLIGHTLGASGLVELVLTVAACAGGNSPANLRGLHTPAGIALAQPRGKPDAVANPHAPDSLSLLKIASGMGGHNAAVLVRRGSAGSWVA